MHLVPPTDASPYFGRRSSEVKWNLPSHDMNDQFAMQNGQLSSMTYKTWWFLPLRKLFNSYRMLSPWPALPHHPFLSYWPNMAAIANAPFGTRGAGVWNLHSFDVGWTTKTTYHILNTKLVSHLLTSWNLQNSPRILFLRLFPTSGCPEMGYIPIYGCFARKMNINQFRSNQFLTVSGCFHYPHKNSHIEW